MIPPLLWAAGVLVALYLRPDEVLAAAPYLGLVALVVGLALEVRDARRGR